MLLVQIFLWYDYFSKYTPFGSDLYSLDFIFHPFLFFYFPKSNTTQEYDYKSISLPLLKIGIKQYVFSNLASSELAKVQFSRYTCINCLYLVIQNVDLSQYLKLITVINHLKFTELKIMHRKRKKKNFFLSRTLVKVTIHVSFLYKFKLCYIQVVINC